MKYTRRRKVLFKQASFFSFRFGYRAFPMQMSYIKLSRKFCVDMIEECSIKYLFVKF